MKYSELHRILKANGCCQIGTNRHPWWYSPATGLKFQTSHHSNQEVPKGTLKSIFKAAGIND